MLAGSTRSGHGRSVGALLLLVLAGCKLQTTDDGDGGTRSIDFGSLEDAAQQAIDDIANFEICPGQTVEELLTANSLSDECREALLSYLPEPETSFEGALFAPSGARVVDGEVHVLLQGASTDGTALTAEALAALEVSINDANGMRVLDPSEYTVTLAVDLPADLASIAIVNDYSASMLERDIVDVSEVEAGVFECLPPVHESEVLRFSQAVETVLDFTTDTAALTDAVTYDASFDRGTTALLDALGTAAGDLATRTRPVRLLVLSTDGGENASTTFDEAEVLAALDEADVFVVALGALLADVDFMRRLTDGRGVFIYTREFSALQSAARPYLDSLKNLVELRVAPLDPPPSEIAITAANLELHLTVAAN